MKSLGILFIAFFTLSFTGGEKDENLEFLRSNFHKAADDQFVCLAFIEQMDKRKDESIYLGYLGLFQAINAKHGTNFVLKLRSFNTGRANIDKAIKLNPSDVELRFIRLSVQKNCPSFLGYNKNISEDEAFIEKHLSEVKSAKLKALCYKVI